MHKEYLISIHTILYVCVFSYLIFIEKFGYKYIYIYVGYAKKTNLLTSSEQAVKFYIRNRNT